MKLPMLAASILFLSLALEAPLTAQPAVYAPVGTGCPGSDGIPLLTNLMGDLPGIGTSFGVELSRVADSGFAIGILGLSNSAISGMPLPLDLGLIGMPGCTLYSDMRRQVGLTISGGRAEWWTDIPADPSWMGRPFYQQAIVIDSTVPGLGAVMSNGAMGVVGILPDLTIPTGAPTLTPDPVAAGGDVKLSAFAVRNEGLFPAIGAFHTGIYLSGDPTITESDLLLDSILINGLVPGLAIPVAPRTVTLPAALTPGIYWIGILADRSNAIAEMDETNNFVAGQITVQLLPDLYISSGTPTVSPDPVLSGMTANVSSFAVGNQGLFPAIGVFHTGIYLSTNSTITTSDTLLDSIAINTLVPGLSVPVAPRTVTIPAGLPPGDYWLGVLVDRTNAIWETDETNNSVARLITVRPAKAELVITSGVLGMLTAIPRPLPFLPVPLPVGSFTVQNQGGVHTGPFTVGYYHDSNGVSTITPDDRELDSVSHPGLAPGESYTFPAHTVVIPPVVLNGWNDFGILVDNREVVDEENEDNNWRSRTVFISLF